jgi:hypothetical protein
MMLTLAMIRSSVIAGTLLVIATSSKAEDVPQEFRGNWRFLPFPDSSCAIRITNKRVEYSDMGCSILRLHKEKDKFKLRLKCRFIDEGKDWEVSEVWGIVMRDERRRFFVKDSGRDFDVLERCDSRN